MKKINTAKSPFAYEGRDIRHVMIDNEPWLVGADMMAAIGESELRLKRLPGIMVKHKSGRRTAPVQVLNVGTVTRFLMDIPEAEDFAAWLFGKMYPLLWRASALHLSIPETQGLRALQFSGTFVSRRADCFTAWEFCKTKEESDPEWRKEFGPRLQRRMYCRPKLGLFERVNLQGKGTKRLRTFPSEVLESFYSEIKKGGC